MNNQSSRAPAGARAGRFGAYGGRYVPEALMAALEQLDEARLKANVDPAFQGELERLHRTYTGRPSIITEVPKFAEYAGGARILLKREDLNHTGSHKLNNVLGQALLTKRMGKTRIIAETGAGQHGVASATAAALMSLECVVYMGQKDMERQALNVARMRLLGAEVIPVSHGSQTLKDAINEAMRDWVTNVETTHYLIGTVTGPHPFPVMVRDFQRIIGVEARAQVLDLVGRLPDAVCACVGGGSNAGAHSIRQTPDEVKHLGPRLDTDDALEVTHHLGERVRAGDGADHIVGGLDVGDPVAHRLVDRVLEGRAAMVHRDHLGAQQLHPSHIQCLTPRVLRTHVDDALKAHQGSHSGTRHTVLTCAGLGDDARLAHLFGQQGLAERIVDLVRAGVVEVLTLEQDAGAPGMLSELRDLGDDARTTGVGAVQPLELTLESRVDVRLEACLIKLLKSRHEGLRNVTTAIRAEAAGAGAGWSPAGLVVHQTPCWRNAGWVPAATRAATASRGRPPMTRLSPTSTAEAPARAYSSTSCGPRTPDSATLTIPWGMRGASRAKVPRSTSRVLRFRALMPMTRAPASIARSVSASSWTSTNDVIPRDSARSRRPTRVGWSRAATISRMTSAP